jgi:hypothetical protein
MLRINAFDKYFFKNFKAHNKRKGTLLTGEHFDEEINQREINFQFSKE